MYFETLVLALFAFCYSVFAGRIEKTVISGPMVFVSFGILMGPLGLSWFDGEVHFNVLRLFADMTLVLILFSDAAHVEERVLRTRYAIPARMLLLGLPGAILLGALAALVLFDALTLFEAAIVGTILAATDAALGKAVVTDERLPKWVRVGLNVESGLNDGLCVPLLLIFIAFTLEMAGTGAGHADPLMIVVEELGIGLAVGVGLTFVASQILLFCLKRGWITDVWRQVTVPALALSCFALASEFHGSGYIAAFSGGLIFGHFVRGKTGGHFVLAAEAVGETLAMLTWFLFGSTVVASLLGFLTWEVVAYAAISLTVVRMVPIFLCLIGTQTSSASRLFLGWFGPRGLASIVFVVIVLDSGIDGGDQIALIAATTVLFSLVAHGLTARPFTAWLAASAPDTDP